MRIIRGKGIQFSVGSLILLIILVIVHLPAGGQILHSVQVGFQDRFSLDHWAPVKVKVKNYGRELNGIIEIETGRRLPFGVEKEVVVYQEPVWISSFSEQEYIFYLLLNQVRYPLIVRFHSPQREEEIKVSLESFSTEKALFLITDYIPSGLVTYSSPYFSTIAITGKDFPEKWKGYDGVQVLLLADRIAGQLNDAQIKALQDWVYTGGTLIISLGVNFHQLVNERWEKFLPLKIKGRKVVTSLPNLEKRYGRLPERWGPLVLVEGILAEGEKLITEGDFPLLTQAKRGEGKVICMNFDYTTPVIENWQGNFSFWQDLLKFIPPPKEKEILQPEKDLALSLMRLQPEYFPPRSKVSLFTLSYFILLAGWRYSLYRKGRKKLFVWWTILPLLLILFGWLGYFSVGEKAHSKNVILNGVALIQASGQGEIARVDTQVNLLSPIPRKVDLFIEDPGAIVYPLNLNQKRTDFYFEENASGINIKNVYLNLHSPFSFQMDFLSSFRLNANLQRKGEILQIKIFNHTSFSLKDIVLFSEGRFFRLGNLNRGEEISRKLRLEEGIEYHYPPEEENTNPEEEFVNEQEMREKVWEWMGRRYYQEFQQKTYLMGWCDFSSWPLSVREMEVNLRIYTLFQLPLENSE